MTMYDLLHHAGSAAGPWTSGDVGPGPSALIHGRSPWPSQLRRRRWCHLIADRQEHRVQEVPAANGTSGGTLLHDRQRHVQPNQPSPDPPAGNQRRDRRRLPPLRPALMSFHHRPLGMIPMSPLHHRRGRQTHLSAKSPHHQPDPPAPPLATLAPTTPTTTPATGSTGRPHHPIRAASPSTRPARPCPF